MDYLLHAIFRHYGQLSRPSGAFSYVERLYRTGISLDRHTLRNHHSHFSIIYAIANLLPAVLSIGWEVKRLSMGYCHLVGRRLPACTLWLGHGNESGTPGRERHAFRFRRTDLYHRHYQCVLLHCRTHCAGCRRIRQLPCCHQGDSRIFPKKTAHSPLPFLMQELP